jgi:hypothetical protein
MHGASTAEGRLTSKLQPDSGARSVVAEKYGLTIWQVLEPSSPLNGCSMDTSSGQ